MRHASKDLPKFAIPTFLRIVKEPAMNNTHKQSKTSIRDEGVDPARTGEDPVFFLQGNEYVRFQSAEWGALGTSRLKL